MKTLLKIKWLQPQILETSEYTILKKFSNLSTLRLSEKFTDLFLEEQQIVFIKI